MRNNKMFKFSSLVLLVFVLWACDDSKINTDYSELKKSSVKDAPLSKTSNSHLATYIKNGIRLRLAGFDSPITLLVEAVGDNDVASSSFSTTNVHEIGVDEADRLKYDGEYLYQVNQQGYQSGSGRIDNSIRILKTNAAKGTAQLVSQILNDSEDLQVSDIFLRPDSEQLISIKNTQYYSWITVLSEDDWQWNSGKTEIQLYDVQTPENPTEQWKIEIEGNLEGSRRIGNMLYLVTRYVPNIELLNYGANTNEEKAANELLILNTPLSDLLPHFQTNDGAVRSLVDVEDCLVADGTENIEGYADIITLSAIDLDSMELTSATCLNANVQGIYSSTNGFYIGGSANEPWFGFPSFTAIHKFELTETSIEYKASASLAGSLGWGDPSFRMSEYQNNLRIVTSSFNQTKNRLEHHLTILREDGSRQLQTIASLPNNDNPEPIGKPGEDIFSVRFTNNRAYIVTFERIDPLYVIDLAQPENPVIAGALEIPGFSRYLHPLSSDWLLGIGNEVIGGRQEGVKLELYDIRDIGAPVVKNTLVFGQAGSRTEATSDLRSISLLNVNEQQKRLAFPIDIWHQQEGSSFNQWKESGLFLFDINTTNTNEMNVTFAGKMVVESANEDQNYPLNSGIGRSKLHDNAVFYLHGNQIFSSLWGQWELQNGPY